MIHFFGILQPGIRQSAIEAEAPHKTDFFGGMPDPDPARLSRAERDALLLSGKSSGQLCDHDEDSHIVKLASPLYF